MTTETAAGRAATDGAVHQENSAYELFMGVLSILSLIVMVWLIIVRDPLIETILVFVDLIFCSLFLIDFARSFARASSKRVYMFGSRAPGRRFPRGTIDLLSSLPGVFNTQLAIFRLFRLFRVARVARILRVGGPRKVLSDFLGHREQSAVYLIALAVILVITLGSIGEVIFEADAPGANITTSGDSVWYTIVTITTVGYGDKYPVTPEGRLMAILIMVTGIAIFGVVTSLVSSFILGGRDEAEETAESSAGASPPPPDPLADEVAGLRAEIAELRTLIEDRSGTG